MTDNTKCPKCGGTTTDASNDRTIYGGPGGDTYMGVQVTNGRYCNQDKKECDWDNVTSGRDY